METQDRVSNIARLIRIAASLPETGQSEGFGPAHGEKEFEILRLLGGSGPVSVYLARQTSLGRKVALKIGPNTAGVKKSQGVLEHENIVRVFSEVVDTKRDLRFVYRQFVPGISLLQLKQAFEKGAGQPLSGPAVLSLIDSYVEDPMEFNPAFIEERTRFSNFNWTEILAHVGLQLSEALEYAHRNGIPHQNIKLESILINPYGRPYLADFDGTESVRQEAKDETALTELCAEDFAALARVMLAFFPPTEAKLKPRAYSGLKPLTLRQVLQTVQTDAIPSLSARLRGFSEWQQMERAMPPPGFIMRLSLRFPLLSLLGVRQFPHLTGTAVCTAYCLYRQGTPLSEFQKFIMVKILRVYSMVSYPLGIGLIFFLAYALIARYRKRGKNPEPYGSDFVLGWNRHSALRLPLWLAGVNSLTWLPSIGVFAAASYALHGYFHASGFVHFLNAVIFSWLIATSYSTLYALFFSVQVLYPRFLDPKPEVRKLANQELRLARKILNVMPAILAMIPLSAALIMVRLGPEDLRPESFRGFRILLLSLITGGGVGFFLSIHAMHRLGKVIEALSGQARRGSAFLSAGG